ncbi:gamete antigen 27/25, putative [Plasmodium malariae]|uniref:Gamete antigen 27/25, putative n=1 Tax=Plasmodium malariae TaxID=5858 RepID=A0A1D3TE36_PLAMA|nr:gamete antigen 27/25, putative [Plasmodium malariae]SCP03123.1 gamete antigen 27/25, putative [Plasmodium malariae]
MNKCMFFLKFKIFVLYAFINCTGGYWKRTLTRSGKWATVSYEFIPYYKFDYTHFPGGKVRKEVKELGDVEFDASLHVLSRLLHYRHRKKEIFDILEEGSIISSVLSEYQEKKKYNFKDITSREHCVNRIKTRLIYIVIEGILTREYLELAKKYFWIEQRVDEEMSVKVFNQKTEKARTKMCKNEVEIKKLISKLERGKSVKLSEGMIANTVSTVEDFLLDVLRTSKEEVASNDSTKKN